MVDIKAIYASKLFKSSSRQDNILLAYQTGALNKLAVQMPESVDDRYRPLTVRKDDTADSKSNSEPDSERNEASGSGPSGSGGHSMSHGGGGGSFSSDPSDLPSMDDLVDVPDSEFLDDSSEPDAGTDTDTETDANPDDAVEQSTDLGISVNTADFDDLKDTLNSSDKTAGVSRIKKKDSELWVYYSDDINLNNVMVDTIDVVQDSVKEAEFNRLARSDNAVVFQLERDDANAS